MPVTREILNSHPVGNLRKEISKTNIKGYSKMKKAEIVELMMKNKERFSHITNHKKAPRKAPEKKAPSAQPKKKIKFKVKKTAAQKKSEKIPEFPDKFKTRLLATGNFTAKFVNEKELFRRTTPSVRKKYLIDLLEESRDYDKKRIDKLTDLALAAYFQGNEDKDRMLNQKADEIAEERFETLKQLRWVKAHYEKFDRQKLKELKEIYPNVKFNDPKLQEEI